MKKILLPTDFSKHAEKAYAVAASIAKTNEAKICFYHMIISELSDGSIAYRALNSIKKLKEIDESVYLDSKKKLEDLTKNPIFEGVEMEVKVELNFESNSPEDMVEEMNELNFDLIVMGTSGLEEKFNSFAEVVIRNSKAPVITCREEASEFKPENVLIATDFSTLNAGFFKRLDLALGDKEVKKTLLFINTKKGFHTSEEIERKYRETVNKYYLKNTELLVRNADEVVDGIFKVTDKEDFDLLALTTRGRKGMSRLFFGSNAENVVNYGDIPVFTYNLHDFLDTEDVFVTRNII